MESEPRIRKSKLEVEFVWDGEKQRSNLEKHGVDFEDAVKVFKSFVTEEVDRRRDYGETRINVTGLVSGEVLVVTYTLRASEYRIISARRANSRERRKYYSGEVGRP